MIVPESRTKSASIQTRLVRPGRSYALVIITENRQPITSQNNKEIGKNSILYQDNLW